MGSGLLEVNGMLMLLLLLLVVSVLRASGCDRQEKKLLSRRGGTDNDVELGLGVTGGTGLGLDVGEGGCWSHAVGARTQTSAFSSGGFSVEVRWVRRQLRRNIAQQHACLIPSS
jgi:hypothetical protein